PSRRRRLDGVTLSRCLPRCLNLDVGLNRGHAFHVLRDRLGLVCFGLALRRAAQLDDAVGIGIDFDVHRANFLVFRHFRLDLVVITESLTNSLGEERSLSISAAYSET